MDKVRVKAILTLAGIYSGLALAIYLVILYRG